VFDGRPAGRPHRPAHGWSPILKKPIALASVPPTYERLGYAGSQIEWTVEGRRGRVNATVVELPFLDLARKRS
jgi:glycine cleavage system aminomethyltransferase T